VSYSQNLLNEIYLQGLVKETKTILTEIKRDTIFKEALLYSLIFFGLAVSILQGINRDNKNWINKTLVILGAVIIAISAINTTIIKYDINDVAMTKAKISKNVIKMNNALGSWKEEENHKIIYDIVVDCYNRSNELYDNYLSKKYGKPTNTGHISIVNKIYAESIRPKWLTSDFYDVNYYYIHGEAESSDYSDALLSAEKNGREALYKKYYDSIGNSTTEEDRKNIAQSFAEKAQIEDTYYEIEKGLVKAYVLLRSSKITIDAVLKNYQLKQMKPLPAAPRIRDNLKMMK
jgi:hypothetical protein